MRALNRDLNTVAWRIIADDTDGKDPNPEDLKALKETVDLIIERLKEEDSS